jgi:hypothetical protein
MPVTCKPGATRDAVSFCPLLGGGIVIVLVAAFATGAGGAAALSAANFFGTRVGGAAGVSPRPWRLRAARRARAISRALADVAAYDGVTGVGAGAGAAAGADDGALADDAPFCGASAAFPADKARRRAIEAARPSISEFTDMIVACCR